MKPIIYYFYDAHCGWCYGFSNVMKKVFGMYNNIFQFKIISGELIDRNTTQHISNKAKYILEAYKTVQEHTGIVFGNKYIQTLESAEHSLINCNSIIPAIGLNAFKYFFPNTLINFASAIQQAHYIHGLDITKIETYISIAEKYKIQSEDFIEQWENPLTRDLAIQDLDFCKQLEVIGYPALAMQVHDEAPLQLIQNGWASYDEITNKLEEIRSTLNL